MGVRSHLAQLAVLLLAAPAAAAPLEFGVTAAVSPARCTTFCFGDGAIANGGVGQSSAFAQIVPGFEQAGGTASVTLDGAPNTLALPTLGAVARGATSGASGETFISGVLAVGADSYTYTGATPKLFTLDVSLTGTVPPPTGFFLGDASASATVHVFAAQNFVYTPLLATILFEYEPAVLADALLALPASGSPEQVGATLAFTLQPGDEVYLYSRLLAFAPLLNSVTDAADTLNLSFQDSEGLVNTRTLIPEPASGWLTAVALGALALARLRR